MIRISPTVVWAIIALPLVLPAILFTVLALTYNARVALSAASLLLLILFGLTLTGGIFGINLGYATFTVYFSEGLSSLLLTLVGVVVNVRAERRGEGSAVLFFSVLLAAAPMLVVLFFWSRM